MYLKKIGDINIILVLTENVTGNIFRLFSFIEKSEVTGAGTWYEDKAVNGYNKRYCTGIRIFN